MGRSRWGCCADGFAGPDAVGDHGRAVVRYIVGVVDPLAHGRTVDAGRPQPFFAPSAGNGIRRAGDGADDCAVDGGDGIDGASATVARMAGRADPPRGPGDAFRRDRSVGTRRPKKHINLCVFNLPEFSYRYVFGGNER